MATRGDQTTEAVLNVGPADAGLIGAKLERIRYTAVVNGQDVSPGSNSIIAVAWQPDDSSDQVATTLASTSSVLFSAPAGLHDGHLIVWSRGY